MHRPRAKAARGKKADLSKELVEEKIQLGKLVVGHAPVVSQTVATIPTRLGFFTNRDHET